MPGEKDRMEEIISKAKETYPSYSYNEREKTEHPVDSDEDEPRVVSKKELIDQLNSKWGVQEIPFEELPLKEKLKNHFSKDNLKKGTKRWFRDLKDDLSDSAKEFGADIIENTFDMLSDNFLRGFGLDGFARKLKKRRKSRKERDKRRKHLDDPSYKYGDDESYDYSARYRKKKNRYNDFEEIIFEDQDDADMVSDLMLEGADRDEDGVYTVYEFLSLADVEEAEGSWTPSPRDKNYGWHRKDLKDLRSKRCRDRAGYYLKIPEPYDIRDYTRD